jgi:hypothetical protein
VPLHESLPRQSGLAPKLAQPPKMILRRHSALLRKGGTNQHDEEARETMLPDHHDLLSFEEFGGWRV